MNTAQQNNDELKLEVSIGCAEIKSSKTKIIANKFVFIRRFYKTFVFVTSLFPGPFTVEEFSIRLVIIIFLFLLTSFKGIFGVEFSNI